MQLIQKEVSHTKEGKTLTDQFYLDKEINVPDAKEDIKELVYGKGRVQIEEMRLVENYVQVTGKLYYQILYISEDGCNTPAVLEGSYPFEEMVYTEGNAENAGNVNGAYILANSRTDFQMTYVHSRKVSVRVMIALELMQEQTQVSNLTTDVEGDEGIYKKTQRIHPLELVTMKKDMYRIKEEITIPRTKECIGQILMTDLNKRGLEMRLEEDAIYVQGEVQMFCMYLSENGRTEWIEQCVPYEGRLDCPGIDAEMYYHAQSSLEDTKVELRMDEDGEMRVLGIEGTLNLRIDIYKEEEVELLEDFYSLEKMCTFERVPGEYEELLIQNHSKCKIKESLRIPEMKGDEVQIGHCDGAVLVESIKQTTDGLHIEGTLYLEMLYFRMEEVRVYKSWKGAVPVQWKLECPHMSPDCIYKMTQTIEQLSMHFLGNELAEVKAVLSFDTLMRRAVRVQQIGEVQERELKQQELENRPGIVGYIVKEGDTLWELAKKYMTTVEAIKKANQMESDVIKKGETLLIFRENLSIL